MHKYRRLDRTPLVEFDSFMKGLKLLSAEERFAYVLENLSLLKLSYQTPLVRAELPLIHQAEFDKVINASGIGEEKFSQMLAQVNSPIAASPSSRRISLSLLSLIGREIGVTSPSESNDFAAVQPISLGRRKS